jgi:uncharacterized protein
MAISSIIIDGYNLIGIQYQNLRKEREELIQKLITYRKLKGHEITVVFDGWKSGSQHQEQIFAGGVRIIYSRLGDKADKVIMQILQQERKEWIVITSDREIMNHAWKNSSVPVPSDQFMSRLEQAEADNDLKGDYELLEEDNRMQQKGSPRQRSKKEKALLRVLHKL